MGEVTNGRDRFGSGHIGNKINANFTFYNRLTQDKYADIPLPGSSGITSFRTNNGETETEVLRWNCLLKC